MLPEIPERVAARDSAPDAKQPEEPAPLPPAAWTADRLDVRLRQGRLKTPQLRDLARAVAQLHVRAAPERGATPGRPEALEAALRQSAALLRAAWPEGLELVDALEARGLGALETRRARLLARLAGPRIRVAHGALRSDRIHVDTASQVVIGPASPAPGPGDPCADVAALAVQLTADGRRELAESFVAAYAEAAQDFDLYPLLDLYEALAALALAHEALTGAPGEPAPLRGEASVRARRLVRAALATPLGPPRLVAVGGLVASGKSTLAAHVACDLAGPVVGADAARAWLAPRARHAPTDPAFTDEVYDEVLRRANAVLESGRSVVLDGCFRSKAERGVARNLAAAHDAPFLFVECRVDAAVARRRLAERAAADGVPESHWLGLFDGVRGEWEPVLEIPKPELLAVDTARAPETAALRVARSLAVRGVPAPVRRVRPDLAASH